MKIVRKFDKEEMWLEQRERRNPPEQKNIGKSWLPIRQQSQTNQTFLNRNLLFHIKIWPSPSYLGTIWRPTWEEGALQWKENEAKRRIVISGSELKLGHMFVKNTLLEPSIPLLQKSIVSALMFILLKLQLIIHEYLYSVILLRTVWNGNPFERIIIWQSNSVGLD